MEKDFVFPQRLKELRLKKGMTQKELAQKLDIPVSTLRAWERGLHVPSGEGGLRVLIKLYKLYGIPTDYCWA